VYLYIGCENFFTTALTLLFHMHKDDILQYLEKLGLSAFESEVFLALYTLGSKPASVIAKEIGKERTHTYKVIQKLMQK